MHDARGLGEASENKVDAYLNFGMLYSFVGTGPENRLFSIFLQEQKILQKKKKMKAFIRRMIP